MRYERKTPGMPPSVGTVRITHSPSLPVAPEGGIPAYPGNDADVPSLPIAPEGGTPAYPGNGADVPSLPIAPEGGIPAYPGNGADVPSLPIAPEGGIPAYPGPSAYCSRVRVLNAALDTPPIRVKVGRTVVTESLSYANSSSYQQVSEGFQTVSVMAADWPKGVLLQTTMPFRSCSTTTLALVRTHRRLLLMQITDGSCRRSTAGCLRCVNLVPDSPALDVALYGGEVIFSDLQFKEVTPYRMARPGSYQLYAALAQTAADSGIEPDGGTATPEVLVSIFYDAYPGVATTFYFLGHVGPGEALLVLPLTDG